MRKEDYLWEHFLVPKEGQKTRTVRVRTRTPVPITLEELEPFIEMGNHKELYHVYEKKWHSNLNAPITSDGNTIFHVLLERKSEKLVKNLAQMGAVFDLDIENDAGVTARKLLNEHGSALLKLELRDAENELQEDRWSHTRF